MNYKLELEKKDAEIASLKRQLGELLGAVMDLEPYKVHYELQQQLQNKPVQKERHLCLIH